VTDGPAIGFWKTVRLLLRASRRRSRGRRRRQRELLRGRPAGEALAGFAVIGAFLYAAMAHGAFSYTLNGVFMLAAYHEAERDGRLLVGPSFLREAAEPGSDRENAIRDEARNRTLALGGEFETHEARLRDQLEHHPGDAGFVVARARVPTGLAASGPARDLGLVAGMFVVAMWFMMMAFQGEGLELDVQRQRHPMWEWLFSHPIRPGAAFFAEMLGPLSTNPILTAAPVFWGATLWLVHGSSAFLPGVAVGAAMAVAASCVSKAIEVTAIVRLPPRSRGAAIGLLSWIGYSALAIGLYTGLDRTLASGVLSLVEHTHWLAVAAPARWLFGLTAGDEPSLGLAVVTGIGLSAAMVAGSVWLTARAADVGITGKIDTDRGVRRRSADHGRWRLVRDPLLRKEMLWFARDRSAMVQAVLIPLTMGATQAFQFRSMASAGAWHWLCGFGVLCGTYMLSVVGPRSLASEGGALWIPLTWPRGLEPLLKAKARLWWLLSTTVVFAVLAYALSRFPGDGAWIALVAVDWVFFGRSLAEKMVTLVVAPSSSGEPEPIPRGRRWAAQLGTFSFGAGIMTQNWHLAALGVIYSSLTATAMWQNFRERLPCLFDPDSERLPPPPTLMHAMVAISAMVDGMGLVAVLLLLMGGYRNFAATQSAAYGITALVTWLVTSAFLARRDVSASSIWRWPAAERSPEPALVRSLVPVRSFAGQLLLAAVVGLVCGAFGLGYVHVVQHVPWVAEQLAEEARRLAENPVEERWLMLAAVAFAPLAEEYLFRGLLFRALDREWGGWKALLGTTLFFTVYHPALAWVPVATVGFVLAVAFKATGSLWPGVVIHAIYNAVVTFAD
jgi:membrane protease YdiL (CAAX protease family)